MTEINYNSVSSIREFLEKNNLCMKKKFGQNFLINPDIRQTLLTALDAGAKDTVWEIGPGIGAMTKLLLDKGLSVRAFEIDAGFNKILKNIFCKNENFTLVEGDVLNTWKTQPAAKFLLGNLPYNIGATLIANLIINKCFFKRMIVTVQREVALRMSALPKTADYSAFSLICASAYNVKPLMLIKNTSFYPKPNVDSQGVLLELKEGFYKNLPDCFFPLVKQLFSSRRKMIKNNLEVFLKNNKAFAGEALKKSSIDGNRRAEELSLGEFLALAKNVSEINN